MQIVDTSYLCGYFSTPNGLPPMPQQWHKVAYTDAERANLYNYYFPEFAQCMTNEIQLYTLPVDQSCTLDFEDEKATFHIDDLRLWEAPFGIILYAVHIRFENTAFNTVTRTLNTLRNCAYYGDIQRPFVDLALSHIIAIYNASTGLNNSSDGDLSWLVESGNKFKLFHILQVPDGIASGDEQLLLYDAATLAPHTPLSTGINSPQYIDHILAEHTISVFAGWTGLALLDTFTIVSSNTPQRVINNWEKDYFEKIYIYQLFRKVFLYTVNLHYRRRIEDASLLEKRLDVFEQQYSYTAISYNFLPNIINAEIEKSLNTQRDYDQLDRMIGKEIESRRDQAEQKTNRFLTFLTCITIFSAIYDFASLLNDSFGYDTIFPNGYFGFRIVSTLTLLIVLLVYITLMRKK